MEETSEKTEGVVEALSCGPMRRCQPNVEDAEKLRKAVLAELDAIEANLRTKGDHYRADKVAQFKRVFFINRDSNFEVIKKDGTIRFV